MGEEDPFEEYTTEQLLEMYRDFFLELDPAIRHLEALKKACQTRLLETGEKPQIEALKITFRRPGKPSLSWSKATCQKYAKANPDFEALGEWKGSPASVSLRVGL